MNLYVYHLTRCTNNICFTDQTDTDQTLSPIRRWSRIIRLVGSISSSIRIKLHYDWQYPESMQSIRYIHSLLF